MFQTIYALVMFVWTLIDPALVRSPDARAIAMAIAQVTVEDARAAVEDPRKAPIFSSRDVDVVVEAVYVAGESGARRAPKATSWDAKAGISCGAFQEPCEYVAHHSLVDQARLWMHFLRVGKKDCPDSPAAMLGGHCHIGRPLAEYRVATALELLREAMRHDPFQAPPVAAENLVAREE